MSTQYSVSLQLQVQQALQNLKALTAQFIKFDKEVDDATDELNKFEKELKDSGRQVKNTTNSMEAYIAKLKEKQASLDVSSKKFRLVQAEIDRFTDKLEISRASISGLAQGLVGLGVGFTLKAAADQLNQFGQNLEGAKASVATLAGDDFDKVQADIKELVSESNNLTNATEANLAAYEALSAGVSTADLKGVLEASTLLSAADPKGATDQALAIDLLTTAINSYGLSAKEAGKLADQFVQTQADGKIVISEIAANLGKAAPVAAGLGISLAELNAALASTTAQGSKAEVAATGIRSALTKLAAPTEEMKKIFKDYKIEINAASIGTDGLVGTLKKLQKITSDEDLLKVVGTEAGTTVQQLLRDIQKLTGTIQKQEDAAGTAKTAADKLAKSYAGINRQLDNAKAQAVAAIWEELGPVFIGVATAIKDAITAFNSLPEGTKSVIIWIGTITALLLGLASLIAVVGLSVKGFMIAWIALGKAFLKVKAFYLGIPAALGKIAGGLKAITGAATLAKAALIALPWVALAAGVTAAGVAIFNYYQEQKELDDLLNASTRLTDDLTGTQDKLKTKIDEVSGSLKKEQERLEEMEGKGRANARAINAQTKRVQELKTNLETLQGEYQAIVKLRIEEEYIKDYDATQGAAVDIAAIRKMKGGADYKPPEPDTENPDGGGGGSKGEDIGKKLADQLFKYRQKLQMEELKNRIDAENMVYELGKELAEKQLEVYKAGIGDAGKELLDLYQQLEENPLVDDLRKVQEELTLAILKEQQLREAVGRAEGPVATEGAEQALSLQSQAVEDLIQQEMRLKQGRDALAQANAALFAVQLKDLLNQEAEAIEKSNAALRQRIELENSGASEEYIQTQEALAEFEEKHADRIQVLNDQLEKYQRQLAGVAEGSKAYQEAAKQIDKAKASLDEATKAAERTRNAIKESGKLTAQAADPLRQYMVQLRRSVEDTRQMIVDMAVSVENAVGSAFNQIVNDVIAGNANIAESFSKMFAQIGQDFIAMATKMIAKALILKALQALGIPILPVGSSAGGGGGGAFGIGAAAASGGGGDGAFGIGAAAAGGSSISSFGPSLGIGAAAAAPTQAVSSASSMFNPFASSVVDNTAAFATAGKALASSQEVTLTNMQTDRQDNFYAATEDGGLFSSAPLDIRYESVVINETQYVTADEFERGVQGATKQAQANTMRDLKNRPAQRKKVGMA